MISRGIPETLPRCELLQVLAEKVCSRHDIDFGFFGRLDDLRHHVSGEVRQINQLFPEYTPHDEQYHLKRLFYVADTVLGRERLEEMNSAELLVLAVALYGHDWGMAVSDSEKQYILTGEPPKGANAEDSWFLPDEHDHLARFATKHHLAIDVQGHIREISIEMWREYVRQTHAVRSAERIRRFFEPIDGGVAEAALRVCAGHWLDFEDLEDYHSYPTNFSVLREMVNLRALAIYLRLIDLLDLAEDRTPYVIWKFVAPRDPRSKMEWAKHRALRPVTCRPYQEGRVIQVDGSTDDHEVYAALEDLRIWCEEQLRGCNDLMARMNDPRHKLDLYHIDWRVAARGFKPVLIQFRFDRDRMFEILSDDIYQGDSYVFLRELLQNSMDAIRMRREILRRKGIDPRHLGVIRVTVEHGESGGAVVTWRDDGVGMDEYVVHNYLAVAGKSYYRSADFEREGLELDPISRFGIGLLSCFMVAERIEIETFKDPYLSPPGEPLKIVIPAVRRQFRIEVGTREVAEIGTTVRVFVEGKRLAVNDESEPIKPLDVTAYLSIVAGFVEFPIVITEGDRKTIVLSPNQDAEVARQRFGEDFQVHQLHVGYPWSEAILPQDLPIARNVLREKHHDLSSDLGLADVGGFLTYLVPADDGIDLTSAYDPYLDRGVRIIVRGEHDAVSKLMRYAPDWSRYRRTGKNVGISRSSSPNPTYALYRDGILLATASPPPSGEYSRRDPCLPTPRLVVNLPKSRAPRIDLARTQLLGQPEHWSASILQAFSRNMIETSLKDLLALDPVERWYQLGRLIAYHGTETKNLWQDFPHERWPLLFLEVGGGLASLEYKEVSADRISLCPRIIASELKQLVKCRWQTQEEYVGFLLHWAGEKCLIPSDYAAGIGASSSIEAAMELWRVPVESSHLFAGVRFLHSPWEDHPPLLQRILHPYEVPDELPDAEKVLKKGAADPASLNPAERAVLHKRFSDLVYGFPEIAEFPYPFEQSFAYDLGVLNVSHPAVQALVRCVAATVLSELHGALSKDQYGRFQDALRSVFRPSYGEQRRWPNSLRRLWSLVRDMQQFDPGDIEDLVPADEEFVLGMTHENVQSIQFKSRRSKKNQPFGMPLA